MVLGLAFEVSYQWFLVKYLGSCILGRGYRIYGRVRVRVSVRVEVVF